MARRKGMMVGKGKKGYHNVVPKDKVVHSQSARGIKQPQRIREDLLIDRFAEENKTNKLTSSDLSNFTGTESYHRWSIIFPNFVLTDGANYLAEKTGSFWFMDVIGSYQYKPKFRKEGFQVWKLKATQGREAIVVAEDGNGNKIGSQKIPYTDFFDKYDGKEIKVYFIDGVILLPSEY